MVFCLEPEAKSRGDQCLQECVCATASVHNSPKQLLHRWNRVIRYPGTTIFWIRVALYTGTALTTRIQMIIDGKLDGSLFAKRGTNKKPIVSEGQYLTKLFSLTDWFLGCYHYPITKRVKQANTQFSCMSHMFFSFLWTATSKYIIEIL